MMVYVMEGKMRTQGRKALSVSIAWTLQFVQGLCMTLREDRTREISVRVSSIGLDVAPAVFVIVRRFFEPTLYCMGSLTCFGAHVPQLWKSLKKQQDSRLDELKALKKSWQNGTRWGQFTPVLIAVSAFLPMYRPSDN